MERCCDLAQDFVARLAAVSEGRIEVLNDVVLNQVLVRFLDPERTTTIGLAGSSSESSPTARAG